MQYYQIEGNLKSDRETKKYIETELTKTIIVQMPSLDDHINSRNTLIVGFIFLAAQSVPLSKPPPLRGVMITSRSG